MAQAVRAFISRSCIVSLSVNSFVIQMSVKCFKTLTMKILGIRLPVSMIGFTRHRSVLRAYEHAHALKVDFQRDSPEMRTE